MGHWFKAKEVQNNKGKVVICRNIHTFAGVGGIFTEGRSICEGAIGVHRLSHEGFCEDAPISIGTDSDIEITQFCV